jgi:hypothetical protein
VCKTPLGCGIPISYALFIIPSRVAIITYISMVGGGPRRIFTISSIRVFGISGTVERNATANGFPGLSGYPFPGLNSILKYLYRV